MHAQRMAAPDGYPRCCGQDGGDALCAPEWLRDVEGIGCSTDHCPTFARNQAGAERSSRIGMRPECGRRERMTVGTSVRGQVQNQVGTMPVRWAGRKEAQSLKRRVRHGWCCRSGHLEQASMSPRPPSTSVSQPLQTASSMA